MLPTLEKSYIFSFISKVLCFSLLFCKCVFVKCSVKYIRGSILFKISPLLLCQCLKPPWLAAIPCIFTKPWLVHLRTLTHYTVISQTFLINITWIPLSSTWEFDLRTVSIWWKRVEFQRPSPFQGSCILVKECHVATSKSLKDHWKLKRVLALKMVRPKGTW